MATVTDKTDTPPRRRRRSASTTPPGASGESENQTGGEGASTTDTPPPTPKPRPARAGSLQKRLEDWLGGLALIYKTFGDDYGAELVTDRAPHVAKAWAELAQQNPGVKRVLERLTEGGAWGAVIVSTSSLVFPLLAHHGILPPQIAAFTGAPMASVPAGTMPAWGSGRQRVIIPDPPAVADMTPPGAPDQPPGVFTVAGSNNGATMPPAAG